MGDIVNFDGERKNTEPRHPCQNCKFRSEVLEEIRSLRENAPAQMLLAKQFPRAPTNENGETSYQYFLRLLEEKISKIQPK